MHQPDVGDLGAPTFYVVRTAAEIERSEVCQPFEVLQASVANLGLMEGQCFESCQSSKIDQVGVAGTRWERRHGDYRSGRTALVNLDHAAELALDPIDQHQ